MTTFLSMALNQISAGLGSPYRTRMSTGPSKETRWEASPKHCHVNWVVCDSDWEAEFARVAEEHPRVLAYVKNQGLGFEIPYRDGYTPRKYVPDFILRVDDGRPDPLNLVIEIKGYRGSDAQLKAETMQTLWVPGVNNLGRFGRWAFAEFNHVFETEKNFADLVAGFVVAARGVSAQAA
jgi:type III restriction enzyme